MKILLAEDEKELSCALCTIFNKNNYEVDAVYNGEDAIRYVLNRKYDVIILDVMMPKASGIEVLKKARSENIKTPILILSAKAEVKDKVEGLDAGANDYLAKPFSVQELLARIRALSRIPNKETFTQIDIGNLHIDKEHCVITTPFGDYILANKEMQILMLLVENKDRVVSVDKIIADVWNEDEYVISNNLWVFVSTLRKKMDSIKANIEIQTYRGRGYCLKVKNEEN